jgi:hypothetical protein
MELSHERVLDGHARRGHAYPQHCYLRKQPLGDDDMAGSQPATQGSTWTVESQIEQSQGGPQGIIRGVLITFVTGIGNRGTVFVPDQQYNVPNAYSAIEARAELLDSVSQLRSS